MLQRATAKDLTAMLGVSPAVALLGPRQCGKTTLAKSIAHVYFDIENPSDRVALDAQWGTLTQSRQLVVLDEAQTWPELFSRLRVAIDDDRKRNGRFLLLGSVTPALTTKVSQSLAGRLALVELTPFLFTEVSDAARDRLWLNGGLPDGGTLDPTHFPRWQRNYLSLLAQRDLPAWGLPAKPEVTTRFLKMLAALQGQTWNATQIGASMGLDYKTINSYLDFLVGAFIIRRLPPYHANIHKRLVKTPKVYLRDTGLLHALLNVTERDNLFTQPWVGASWEGYVIEQIISTLKSAGKFFEPYFFRTSDQHEIDLVLDFGSKRVAIEIKLTSNPSPVDLARLQKDADLIGAAKCILVSNTADSIFGEKVASCNLEAALSHLLA